MAQIQQIKRRIRSVTNTRQITKAMELVSASKMKRSQAAVLKSRPYTKAARDILSHIMSSTQPHAHPFFIVREVKNELIIALASDRGLAGSYNSAVIKRLLTTLEQHRDKGIKTFIIAVGQKLAHTVSSLKEVDVIGIYTNLPSDPTSLAIRPITESAIDGFLQQKWDQVRIIGTEFTSTLRQSVESKILIPMVPPENAERKSSDLLFEPSAQAILNQTLPRLVEGELFHHLLEANASEHSMRMMAMKNASDNAQDLVDDLTQYYNTERQALITQELAEISSGAEALQTG